MPREGQIRLCENYSSQIGRLPDTTRCLQIAVQFIQINQQDTVILGEGAGRAGETGTGKEGVVHRWRLSSSNAVNPTNGRSPSRMSGKTRSGR